MRRAAARQWILCALLFLGVGMWITMYLTMAQEVCAAHVSTASGPLCGSGSLAGAVAMWAVGRVTRDTGSFLISMAAVSVAAGYLVSTECKTG